MNAPSRNKSKEEKECFDNLKTKWSEKYPDESELFDDEMILRFAYCSPGAKKFNETASWKVMKNFDKRFLNLKAVDLEEEILKKKMFPVPGLKTLEGEHDVLYMCPSRDFPTKTKASSFDNFVYGMTSMQDGNEKSSKEGIVFVSNMKDCTWSNFSLDQLLQLNRMLHGSFPVRLRMFLVVNAPGLIGTIWSMMKPMISTDMRKKVNMIPESELSKYFSQGFEEFLPDDFADGRASTDDIVKDFVAYRKSIE